MPSNGFAGWRSASSPSPCHHLRMRRSSKTAKQTSPTERSPRTIESVAYRGTSPRLSRIIEPGGDWDQLDLATGDVDLTTAAGIDVGGGSQAEHRDNRDRRSRSSGTQPQSLDTTVLCYQLIGPIRMFLTVIYERENNHDVETNGVNVFRSLRGYLRFATKVYADCTVRLRPLAPV